MSDPNLKSRMSAITTRVANLTALDDTVSSLQHKLREKDDELRKQRIAFDQKLAQFLQQYKSLETILSAVVVERDENIQRCKQLESTSCVRFAAEMCEGSSQTESPLLFIDAEIQCELDIETFRVNDDKGDNADDEFMDRIGMMEVRPSQLALVHKIQHLHETHSLNHHPNAASICFSLDKFNATTVSPRRSLAKFGHNVYDDFAIRIQCAHAFQCSVYMRDTGKALDESHFMRLSPNVSVLRIPERVNAVDMMLYPPCCCTVSVIYEPTDVSFAVYDFRHTICYVNRKEAGVHADTITTSVRKEVLGVLKTCDTQVTEALTHAASLEASLRIAESKARHEKDSVQHLMSTLGIWFEGSTSTMYERMARMPMEVFQSTKEAWWYETAWSHSLFEMSHHHMRKQSSLFSESVNVVFESERGVSKYAVDCFLKHATQVAGLAFRWLFHVVSDYTQLVNAIMEARTLSSFHRSVPATPMGHQGIVPTFLSHGGTDAVDLALTLSTFSPNGSPMLSSRNNVMFPRDDLFTETSAWVENVSWFLHERADTLYSMVSHQLDNVMGVRVPSASARVVLEDDGDCWEIDAVTPALNHMYTYCTECVPLVIQSFHHKSTMFGNAVSRVQRRLVAQRSTECLRSMLKLNDAGISGDIANSQRNIALEELESATKRHHRERTELQAMTHYTQSQQAAHLQLYEQEITLIRDHQRVLHEKYETRAQEAQQEIEYLRGELTTQKEVIDRERCEIAHERRMQRIGLSQCIALTESQHERAAMLTSAHRTSQYQQRSLSNHTSHLHHNHDHYNNNNNAVVPAAALPKTNHTTNTHSISPPPTARRPLLTNVNKWKH